MNGSDYALMTVLSDRNYDSDIIQHFIVYVPKTAYHSLIVEQQISNWIANKITKECIQYVYYYHNFGLFSLKLE